MRKLIVLFIAFFPFTGKMRAKIYGMFQKYHIAKNVSIGFGTVINCGALEIGQGSTIGNLVRIKNIDCMKIGEKSLVNSSCMFCGPIEALKTYQRDVSIGHHANIQCGHYFDVVAPITMKDYVTIAGKGTQMFTHSFDIEGNRLDGAIEIENHVYIGSSCIINLGVQIGNNIVLQAGTVVNKSIEESGVYASQNLVKKGNIHSYSEIANFNKDVGEYKCYIK